jgi:hypothetical protein
MHIDFCSIKSALVVDNCHHKLYGVILLSIDFDSFQRHKRPSAPCKRVTRKRFYLSVYFLTVLRMSFWAKQKNCLYFFATQPWSVLYHSSRGAKHLHQRRVLLQSAVQFYYIFLIHHNTIGFSQMFFEMKIFELIGVVVSKIYSFIIPLCATPDVWWRKQLLKFYNYI